MVDRNYFSTSRPDSLATGATGVATQLVLADGSTFPDPALTGGRPYTVIVGYGTDREEVCTVTGKPTATTLTVVRGEDGTAASAKNAGDTVVHGVSARDFKAIETKVDVAGDTMTGPLILSGDAVDDLGATTKQQVEAAVNDAMPIGSVIDYVGTVAPTGWHLCDGTAHGSAAYLAAFGSANTPDLRGLFVRGAGSGLTNGQTGGAASVTLTAAQSGLRSHFHLATSTTEAASHTHGIDPPNTTSGGESVDHAHGFSTSGGGHGHGTAYKSNFGLQVATQSSGRYVMEQNPWSSATSDLGDHTHSGTTAGRNAGHTHDVNIAAFTSDSGSASHSHGVTVDPITASPASEAHENLPPFYVLTKIVKVV